MWRLMNGTGKKIFLSLFITFFYYLIADSLNMCDLGVDVPIEDLRGSETHRHVKYKVIFI